MALRLVTPPSVEPVSLEAAKMHLRVDHSLEDALILAQIAAAREAAEGFLRRPILTQVFDLVLDGFPAAGELIVVPVAGVVSVASVQYHDGAAVVTMPTTDYVVDLGSERERARIATAPGIAWPATRDAIAAVTIRLTAGWPDAASVPAAIVAAIKLIVGHLHENREEVVTGTIATKIPQAAEWLMQTHRAEYIG